MSSLILKRSQFQDHGFRRGCKDSAESQHIAGDDGNTTRKLWGTCNTHHCHCFIVPDVFGQHLGAMLQPASPPAPTPIQHARGKEGGGGGEEEGEEGKWGMGRGVGGHMPQDNHKERFSCSLIQL